MMKTDINKARSPWWWVPTLYFAEGLPYMAVMTISTIMYKCMGIGNTELAFYNDIGDFLAYGFCFGHT